MATDMFLDLGDTIKGESKDKVYEGKIDSFGWSWACLNQGLFTRVAAVAPAKLA